MTKPLIEVDGLSKRFGSSVALSDMRLVGLAGKVHAVVGENGAGKSTLMKILSGVHKPDAGSIRIGGVPVHFSHPRDAHRAGISTIFQEFSLLPNLSVTENLFLGRERENGRRLPRAELRARARAALSALDLSIDPDRRVGALGVGDQQMIEIAKGVIAEARIFIFDEPTAALASHEVETLFALIRRLASEQKTVFYISHRLSEVFSVCDDITVMKDGCFVTRALTGDTATEAVIAGMVGRPLEELFEPRNPDPGPALLEAEGLTSEEVPTPLTLTLHEGEIVGIAGLEGQGQQAIMRMLAGFTPATGGKLRIAGKAMQSASARARMSAGVGFVPESRKDDGLFLSLDIRANMEIAVHAGRSMAAPAANLDAPARDMMQRLAVKAASERALVSDLSGGNQQKVILGRWLIAGTRLLLCEEPTRGVDVGAKREIYARLRSFANGGAAVLITSRELPELIGLCDRIVIVREGGIVAEVPAAEASEASLLRAALPDFEMRTV